MKRLGLFPIDKMLKRTAAIKLKKVQRVQCSMETFMKFQESRFKIDGKNTNITCGWELHHLISHGRQKFSEWKTNWMFQITTPTKKKAELSELILVTVEVLFPVSEILRVFWLESLSEYKRGKK